MSVDDNFDQKVVEEKKLYCTLFESESSEYVDQQFNLLINDILISFFFSNNVIMHLSYLMK